MSSQQEQINFLLACIKHNPNGAKIDFDAVATELNIPTKAAAAKRYERLKKRAQASDFSNQTTASTSGNPTADDELGGPSGTPRLARIPRTPTRTPRTPRTPRSKKTPKVEFDLDVPITNDSSEKRKLDTTRAGSPPMVLTPVRIFASDKRSAAFIEADTSAESIDSSSVTSMELAPIKLLPPVPNNSPARGYDDSGSKRCKTEPGIQSPVAGKRDSWLDMMLAGQEEHNFRVGNI